jgi:hypothetical protein
LVAAVAAIVGALVVRAVVQSPSMRMLLLIPV